MFVSDRILHQPWGGLGDNLQYSTLPGLYSEKGDKFYISKDNVYRNPEIYELVWALNPYVSGISNKPYNVGACKNYSRSNSQKSIIYNQEIMHGFEGKNDLPIIYYKPKNISNMNDKIFVDISAVSGDPIIPKDNLKEVVIAKYPKIEEKIKNLNVVVPLFKNHISQNHKINLNIKYDYVAEIESLFQYCDVIHSCYCFLCSFSGQSVLAAALNKFNTLCFTPQKYEHNDYRFSNIKYFIV